MREVNGQEEIEQLSDGSRWMLRAKEAVYGYAASLGAADEAWKVRAAVIEEGLEPTMVEREQPQLLLISTAHRLATSLMLSRRLAAIDLLEQGTGELIIEWSASAGVELDDERAWRQASPHWSDGRRKTVARQLQGALRGEVADSDEPDPLQSFQAQWLNRWPERLVQPKGKTVALIATELWADLERDLEPDETAPVWLAVEDDYGLGAAVAACARRGDGRLELDGWGCSELGPGHRGRAAAGGDRPGARAGGRGFAARLGADGAAPGPGPDGGGRHPEGAGAAARAGRDRGGGP